jgi:hypothetical protein
VGGAGEHRAEVHDLGVDLLDEVSTSITGRPGRSRLARLIRARVKVVSYQMRRPGGLALHSQAPVMAPAEEP